MRQQSKGLKRLLEQSGCGSSNDGSIHKKKRVDLEVNFEERLFITNCMLG